MSLDYQRPCKTRVIRDDFEDHKKRKSNLPGVDYATAIGDRVYATAKGTVIRTVRTNNSASGIHVVIRHPDGRQSWYLHLSRILVSVGKRVEGGDLIARSGNTGRSTGPHLHFSIMDKAGKCVDPENVLKKDAKPRSKKPAETVEAPPAPVDAAE